jgi:predicted RNase H-like HicB family nuclease
MVLGTAMRKVIQVRIFKGEKLYVAECLDLRVVTQAATLDELTANLREAIALQLEGENLADLGLVQDPAVFATLELDSIADGKA